MLLLALMVVAFGAAAYRQVRSTTVITDVARLETMGTQAAASYSREVAERNGDLELLATNSTIVQFVAGNRSRKSVDSALADALQVADSSLIGWEIWDSSGNELFSAVSDILSVDSSTAVQLGQDAMRGKAVRISDLQIDGGNAFYIAAFPIQDAGREIGFILEAWRIPGSPVAAERIAQILGRDVGVFFANRASTQWISVAAGKPTRALYDVSSGYEPDKPIVDANGTSQFLFGAPIAATPWHFVLLESADTALDEPHAFIRKMVIIGLLVLLMGTIFTWFISRLLTRPLGMIGAAAQGFSSGDYSKRVVVTGSAEMAKLGESFNAMASSIEDAHRVLAHQNSALKRANESKTRFLAMMSHELRTPLNAIGGYTDLLALGIRGPITPEQANDLARIRRNKEQLLNIIGDILHFARVDAGQINLKMKAVRISDVFRLLEESIAPQFVEKGVHLHFEQTELTVAADAARLQQVLLNLITNAYSFTSAGGRVSLTCETQGARVAIQVADNGIGIPSDRLQKIFEPFEQVDASLTRKIGGTGLGLAIVRELTTAMGGQIDVESTVGVGSTFTVTMLSADPHSASESCSDSAKDSAIGQDRLSELASADQ